ncbi:MAG TPA: hypothetical protein VFF26_00890 [Gallionella sp.]|nr:hypothetical protein [Gallionella sp.]
MDDLDFPQSPDEAKKRFQEYVAKDPFPNIPTALLNAGDIYHYARVTGIVYPFPHDNPKLLEKKLKPASYEIDFLGSVHYTDENGVPQKEVISQGTPFTLKKNTIAFVSIATKFCLPDYIAIRFNLRINLVHKGLLLGTGPLVDPGFSGQLLIPLHNLTSKDYVLIGGEGLIWVEFTKVSNSKIDADALGFTPSFPSSKRDKEAQYYFNESSDGKPAISSIPGEVKTAKEDANKAKEISEKIRNYGIIAVGALVLSLAGVVIATWNLISSANKNVADASVNITQSRVERQELLEKIKNLETQISALSPPMGNDKKSKDNKMSNARSTH